MKTCKQFYSNLYFIVHREELYAAKDEKTVLPPKEKTPILF